MTKEEAIKIITRIMERPHIDSVTNCRIDEALSMAIEALKAEPKHGRWIDHQDEGYVECPFCHSATNCDGNKDELHFCFSCGAKMEERRKDGNTD